MARHKNVDYNELCCVTIEEDLIESLLMKKKKKLLKVLKNEMPEKVVITINICIIENIT